VAPSHRHHHGLDFAFLLVNTVLVVLLGARHYPTVMR
jgi:hypothetical protein